MIVEKLTLQSHNFLRQYQFYVETLGFELLEQTENSFSVKAGNSTLVFKKSATKCYYHFAFNIPAFQILDALDWMQQRVDILKYQGDLIVDFPNWNAKAFYFFDADNNIVEFIDRRNLDAATGKAFSIENLLEISEVGLPVNNILQTFQSLNKQTAIEKYSGDLTTFCSAGDEHGLFIIVDQNNKNWLPTDLPARAYPFELHFKCGSVKYLLKYAGEEVILKRLKVKG